MTRARRLLRMAPLALLLGLGPLPATGCAEPTGTIISGGGCCKVCSTGKACGDSCIARNLTCHKGSGCACNG